MAMVLRRLGKSVLLIERGVHPRFVIGESSTPFANLLLERLAEKYDLPFLKSLSEWGSWQAEFPKIAAGLKRGFTFYHHTPGQRLNFLDRSRQLLVAASPNDRVADTHWYRPDFDAFLVEQAVRLGVEYSDQSEVRELASETAGWTFSVTRLDRKRAIQAGFIIDAGGMAGPLPRHFGLKSSRMRLMPETQAVYAHFRDVSRLDEIAPELRDGALPYPPDDAAVHHVFPGGWCWVLRFNNGITSAGAAYTAAARLPENAPAEVIWNTVLDRLPTLQKSFRPATRTTPFHHSAQLSFWRRESAGKNWLLLPSGTGFVDPLLSTGFPLTLLGILRIGEALAGRSSLAGYRSQTARELIRTAALVGALYRNSDRPEQFSLLTLAYFAAMSFTETAWRLGKEHLAPAFLLQNDPAFSAGLRRLRNKSMLDQPIRHADLEDAIGPYDIAGLTDWTRRNWYPVNFADLAGNSQKVQATTAELAALFAKLGVSVPAGQF